MKEKEKLFWQETAKVLGKQPDELLKEKEEKKEPKKEEKKG